MWVGRSRVTSSMAPFASGGGRGRVVREARPWRRAAAGRRRAARWPAAASRRAAVDEASADRLVMHTNRSPRANARTSSRPTAARSGRHRQGPARCAGCAARRGTARAWRRDRPPGPRRSGRPVVGLAEPRRAAARRAGLNPNGGRVTRPGQRHPAAVATRVDAAGAEVHRVLDLVARQVGRPRRGPARRPGRCTASPAAQRPAAPPPGHVGGRARGRSGTPWRLARNANELSSRP